MSTRPRRTRLSAAVLCGPLLFGALAAAGPLDPPAGPVAPTPGPEPRTAVNAANTPGDSASVFRITQPGSYYLTGNVTGASGKRGIAITVGGVTLDLNGFALIGVAGSLDGITVTQTVRDIAIVNGTIMNWGEDGIDIGGSGSPSCRVAGVIATGNTHFGISVASDSIVTGCTASNNTSNGIDTGPGCNAAGCTAALNGGEGIHAGADCTISNCTIRSNTGNGITVSTGSSVSRCTVNGNVAAGITTAGSATVTDCSVVLNGTHGIAINGSNGLITRNLCSNNGIGPGVTVGSGIYTSGVGSRIEGNTVMSNDVGIFVDTGASNMVVGNYARANTNNYSFPAATFAGTIVTSAASMNAATNSLINISIP